MVGVGLQELERSIADLRACSMSRALWSAFRSDFQYCAGGYGNEVSRPAANFAAQVRRQKPRLWRILELAAAGAQSAEQQRAAIPPGTPMLPRLAQGEPQPEYADA